jgi:hypothetical protein
VFTVLLHSTGHGANHIENTSHVIPTQRVHWGADCFLATSCNIRSIVACAYRGVYIEALPENVLTYHNIFHNHLIMPLLDDVLFRMFGTEYYCGATLILQKRNLTTSSILVRMRNHNCCLHVNVTKRCRKSMKLLIHLGHFAQEATSVTVYSI